MKAFETPVVEVKKFSVADVLSTSNPIAPATDAPIVTTTEEEEELIGDCF